LRGSLSGSATAARRSGGAPSDPAIADYLARSACFPRSAPAPVGLTAGMAPRPAPCARLPLLIDYGHEARNSSPRPVGGAHGLPGARRRATRCEPGARSHGAREPTAVQAAANAGLTTSAPSINYS
jgi:hypothetical protein